MPPTVTLGTDDRPTGRLTLRDGRIAIEAGTESARADLDQRLDGYVRSMVMDHGIPEEGITPEAVLRWIPDHTSQGRNWAILSEDGPDDSTAEHFGVTESGDLWLSESAYQRLGESARVGFVREEWTREEWSQTGKQKVKVQDKNGNQVYRWVKVGTAQGAELHQTPGAVTGPDHVVSRALADPSQLTAADVDALATHARSLPKEDLRKLSLAFSQKVGGKKEDLANRLVSHLQARGAGRTAPPPSPQPPRTPRNTGRPDDHAPTEDDFAAASTPPTRRTSVSLAGPPAPPAATLVDGRRRPAALSDTRRARIESILGRSTDVPTMFAAGNAIDGAGCHITADRSRIQITSGYGADYRAVRTIMADADGDLYCHNDYFEIEKDKPGPDGKPLNPNIPRGADMLANQVRGLRAMGVKYVDTYAAGSKMDAERGGYVGFKVWPKLGYDGPIDDHILAFLPPELKSQMGASKSILDLYATKAGQDWWAENGSGLNLTFDLAYGSRSMKTLEAYLNTRKER